MMVPRGLLPGHPVTWVGPPLPAPDTDLVKIGERGVFLDYDGADDLYVVEFPGGRVFCCKATDVEPARPGMAGTGREADA